MTAPRSQGIGRALRSPSLLLIIPVAVILAVPALTPTNQLFPNQGDVGLYLDNARSILDGRTPYSEVSLEYPPLALVTMVVPYLVGLPFGQVTLDHYKWLFAGWEATLVLVLGFVLIRIARRGWDPALGRDPGWAVVLRYPVLVAGAALVIAWRFDVFAALLLAVALWAALANRPTAAGIALGLGTLAKLFPIVAAPALAIAWLAPRHVDRLARFGLATFLTLVVGMLPFLAMAGVEALSFLGYQAHRGLEIESIGAGVVLLDGLIRGQPVETHSPFKAVEVFGPLTTTWLHLLPAMTLAGFGALGAAAWRRIRSDLGTVGSVTPQTLATLAGTTVMVLLVTSKVFSIQYIVWLVPFAALLRGWQFWLAAAVVALTMPIHPFLFADLVAQKPLAVLILNVRNLLLIVLTASVLVDLGRGRGNGTESREELARPAGLEPTTFRSAT